MSEWNCAVTDLNGTTRAFLDDWALTVIRRLNGPDEMDVQYIRGASGASEVLIGQRCLKLYQDGALRHFGRVWEPVMRRPTQREVKTYNAFQNLTTRRVQADGSGNGVTYTAQDAGAIVTARVAAQEARSPTHLRMGIVQTSVTRTVTYDPGKVEAEIVTDLANMDSGFFFRCDPVDGVSGTWGEIVILYPLAGTDLPAVKFEFGEGTLDNCMDYQQEEKLPKNRILAVGAGSGPSRVSGSATDSTSQATYNLIEDEVSFSDVTDATILQQKAQGQLKASPVSTWTFTPGPDAPRPWLDFDVGNSVYFTVKDEELVASGKGRVNEMHVKITQSGVALLDTLVLEAI